MSAVVVPLRPSRPRQASPTVAMVDAGPSRPFPGSKGAPGVAQRLINLIPPHRCYIEPFLGSGAVMRCKRLAARNIGVDVDPVVVAEWQGLEAVEIHQQCGIDFLADFPFRGDELVYCDPPYLFETRAEGRAYYRHELGRDQHVALLGRLVTLPCRVMVSGYFSTLYADALADWHCETFETATRGGTRRTEHVWLNYSPPVELHDYRYLGSDFREREKIRRRVGRLKTKLENMPRLERQALLAALGEAWPRGSWSRTESGPPPAS